MIKRLIFDVDGTLITGNENKLYSIEVENESLSISFPYKNSKVS